MAPIPNKRAFGLATQSAVDVEPAAMRWFTSATEITISPQITKRRPKYKTNRRIQTRRQKTVTSYAEIQVRGEVEVLDFAPACESGLSTGVVSGDETLYKAGGYANKYVTAAVLMGLDEYWKVVNGRVNVVHCDYNWTDGTITYQLTIRGPRLATVAGAPPVGWGGSDPAMIDSPGNPPFEAWQAVVVKGPDAFAICIVSMMWEVNNNYDPFYCSPLVAPTASTKPGMVPSRFREGEATGTYEVNYVYIGTEDASGLDSSFTAFLDDEDELWVITATDPAGEEEDNLSYTPTYQTKLFRAAGESGTMPLNDPDVMQQIRGNLLFDDTADTFLTVGLTKVI